MKDYPGAWAEYRVYDGGYVQIGRRIAAADAMHWTEQTRRMYAGLYRDYALGTLADRCFTVTLLIHRPMRRSDPTPRVAATHSGRVPLRLSRAPGW